MGLGAQATKGPNKNQDYPWLKIGPASSEFLKTSNMVAEMAEADRRAALLSSYGVVRLCHCSLAEAGNTRACKYKYDHEVHLCLYLYSFFLFFYFVYIYICNIYIYVYIEREKYVHIPNESTVLVLRDFGILEVHIKLIKDSKVSRSRLLASNPWVSRATIQVWQFPNP